MTEVPVPIVALGQGQPVNDMINGAFELQIKTKTKKVIAAKNPVDTLQKKAWYLHLNATETKL